MTNDGKNLRLIIVGVGFALVTLGLWGRLVQVQVFAGAHYDSLATVQSTVERAVPSERGCIFDRSGSPLALSSRSFSLAVQPKQVADREKVVAAISKYLSLSKQSVREKMRSDKPFVYVQRQFDLSKDSQAKLRKLRGVVLETQADRVNPYGATGAKIVGFVGVDGHGMAGVEAAMDKELRGVPGWEKVQRDGRYRSLEYQTLAEKKPVDGKHVYLTIDARLQEIAEMELEKAVQDVGAVGGEVILMDCRTGEILALAEDPSPRSAGPSSRDNSLWTLRSVSCVYEPGSTFKLVTAAVLLEAKKVRASDEFDGEEGVADFGVAVVRDAHPHGRLTFEDGFVQSSNIVMAKAALRLDPSEFIAAIRLFGFGSPTGIELGGESPGQVAPKYSKRTHITLAYGHEIAVTPLQMACAFAAVANDGILVMPRIVHAIEDEATGKIEEFTPVKLRRVVSSDTARELRRYCREVVTEGTGKQAEVGVIEVAGKTGTAQKPSPRGGYEKGKFVSSFIGFAPAYNPKMVCLVVLDEPNFENRLGGTCAAPVFARIIEAIASSSHVFDDSVEQTPAEKVEVTGRRVIAPNFLRMGREAVMDRARTYDLNLLCKGETGEVIAQDPDPGVPIDRDDVLRVYLSGTPRQSRSREVPDLVGMAVRAARRAAAEMGFKCEVVGRGCVVSQWPAPGVVSKTSVMRITCEDVPAKRKAG
jgi:cell division protein FtsI/penicillin-binding protein 2